MLHKFGNMLISRQAGSEAFLAFQPVLKSVSRTEPLEVDFTGVITFSPSWGDEFLTPLAKEFRERLVLVNTGGNLSVRETLKILEQANGISFALPV